MVHLKRVLRIGVSVSLIVYLFSLMDLSSVGQRLIGVQPEWLLLAFVLLLVQTAISALKWRLILESESIALGFMYLYKVYLVGGFLSAFLPSGFGGDVYKIYCVTRDEGNLGKIASSVLFDRMTGLFALASIALVGYWFLPSKPYYSVLVAGYLSVLIGFLVATSDLAHDYLERIGESLGESRIWTLVSVPLRSFRVYRRSGGMLVRALVIAFVFQILHVVICKLYCVALGIEIPFAILLAIVPIVYLTDVLPISINGIGVRDSAFVLAFALLGFAKEEGLSLALLVLFMQYLYHMIGGMLFLGQSMRTQAQT